MQFIALQNLNQQNMIRLAAFISTGELFGFDLNRRLAVIKRCAQQLVDMVLICIDTGDRPVVLNTDGDHSAVSIGKSNQMNCKRLGINAGALAVKQWRFRHSADLFDCQLAAHSPASSL